MVYLKIAGCLFIGYIVFRDVLHGKIFLTLNWVIDTVFETMYILFPLIYFSTNNNIFNLQSLGLLNQQNGFIIIQSLFALTMLTRKCILLMNDLNPIKIANSHSKKVQKSIKTDHLVPWITINQYSDKIVESGFGNSELYRLIVARFENSETVIPRIVLTTLSPSARTPQSPEDSMKSESTFDLSVANMTIDDNNENNCNGSDGSGPDDGPAISTQQCRRKSIVLICGLLFIIAGILILSFFLSFIENDFNNKCLNPNDDIIINNPELQYYEIFCDKKVVNMFNYDYPCNCRQFEITSYNYTDSFKDNITVDMIEQSFIKFNDLEGIFIDNGDSYQFENGNKSFRITHEMLVDLVC